jgi:hypothetical protein
MQLKKIAFLTALSLIISSLNLCAGSIATKSENKVEHNKSTTELIELDKQIEALLDKARITREERDKLEDEADDIESKDPQKAKQLEEKASGKHQELLKMLYQLEDFLKKRKFLMNELGYPDNEEDSPYQS